MGTGGSVAADSVVDVEVVAADAGGEQVGLLPICDLGFGGDAGVPICFAMRAPGCLATVFEYL